MALLSVIVPVYNTEQYLHRCIDSILAQTFSDFELLLVDDGSTDASGAICDEYAQQDPRIRAFHQTNQGQAAARNHALDWMFANSDSEYISFVDSDDWVHPKYLELLLKCLRQYNVRISQCRYIETEGEIESTNISDEMVCITPEEQYSKWYCAFMPCKMYRRSCWAVIRFPEGQIYEDVAIWYRMLFSEERIGLVKEVLYYYFINPSGTVRSDWTPSMLARMDAWDAQLLYLINLGNSNVLQNAVKNYCRVANQEFDAIKQSKKLSINEKKYYQRCISKRIRKVVFRFYRIIRKNNSFWLYLEIAFPHVSFFYWYIKKLLKSF